MIDKIHHVFLYCIFCILSYTPNAFGRSGIRNDVSDEYVSGNTYHYADAVIAIDTTTFKSQIGNYQLRIPFCEVTNKGTIIVGADIRENTASDQTKISIGIVRSTDEGKSFNSPQIILPHTDESKWDRSMDGTILVDRHTGRIYVFAHRIKSADIWERVHKKGYYGFDCSYVYSDDDGITWSAPKSFRDELLIDTTHVVSVFGGVGHGITMSDGTLVLPIQCKMEVNDTLKTYPLQSGIAYSKDHGRSWICESLVPCYSSECMVVEYERGKLMANSKSYIGKRRVYVTDNLGKSWKQHLSDKILIEPKACQGSFHKFQGMGFFLNPNHDKERKNLVLQVSNDYITWTSIIQFEPNNFLGYSCLCNSENHLYAITESVGESILCYKVSITGNIK